MATKKTAPIRAAARAPEVPMATLAQQVRSWADTLMGMAGSATDLGLKLTEARVKDPARRAAVAKAGRQLKSWREGAGMTVNELADAVGLGDARLIDEAEGGMAALPFEVVLRVASVLGRHDPIPMAVALTRQYNPELWKTLEALGVGKLALQGAREREMANIYRGLDAARKLNDEQFMRVLDFTRKAFETAVALVQPAAETPKASAPAKGARAKRTSRRAAL